MITLILSPFAKLRVVQGYTTITMLTFVSFEILREKGGIVQVQARMSGGVCEKETRTVAKY